MADFHFIRPWWLFAIIALALALKLLNKYRLSQSGWQQLLPQHLANVLVDKQHSQQKLSLTLPFIIGLLAIVALAGPTWKKLPQPVYQTARGSVLIMDMSYSMYSTDISPNRLTRSRYKAIDLLEQLNEGEIGLVAYAGDAFTISPLTDDINNIKLLLPSLSPELMPELGSNPLAALTLAHDMLVNAGHSKGDIYWFTDGIDNYDIQDITNWSRSNNHRLNVLGIGTRSGAPIKLNNGELMKDNSGSIIVPKLSVSALKGAAKRGRGYYATLANNNKDIEQLLYKPLDIDEQQQKESSNTGDQWQEAGPYLLLLVLPLLLPYFRRGRLLAILPIMLLITPVDKSYADGSTLANTVQPSTIATSEQVPNENFAKSYWDNLWQTKDQQGQKQFNAEAFQQAANSFENSSWQGSSYYRSGEYEQALTAFQQQDTAEALYNQGNALAQLKRIDEAIEAYTQALKKDPKHEDAKANKTYLEALKKQQEEEEQQQDNQDKDKNKEKNNDENQQQQNQENQNKDQEQKNSDDPSQQSDAEQEGEKKEDSDNKPSKEENSEQEDKSKAEQEQQAQEGEAKDDDKNKPTQTPAQIRAEEQLAEETEQKHQQLLNKVTDDPYMLLRNKMQLEYQKRRNNRSSAKGTKKW
ncbi:MULTISPECIES: vWA domain-containing protein [unclassified Colwellia]|uniref:vWA domain-containing protein n=1 Tax=unclassified Colwellia TaxID=196834 RepID=UPI0015F56306|nr:MULTISPECIES: VWA domain-containing protein [unclassified Colwellia]MBA6255692.1 VWA domain-containing protein [Colwellia sp. MB3u-28]MBA6261833.1 VWA domain-containing protein [Colwellia sp. MB3u-41]